MFISQRIHTVRYTIILPQFPNSTLYSFLWNSLAIPISTNLPCSPHYPPTNIILIVLPSIWFSSIQLPTDIPTNATNTSHLSLLPNNYFIATSHTNIPTCSEQNKKILINIKSLPVAICHRTFQISTTLSLHLPCTSSQHKILSQYEKTTKLITILRHIQWQI